MVNSSFDPEIDSNHILKDGWDSTVMLKEKECKHIFKALNNDQIVL